MTTKRTNDGSGGITAINQTSGGTTGTGASTGTGCSTGTNSSGGSGGGSTQALTPSK